MKETKWIENKGWGKHSLVKPILCVTDKVCNSPGPDMEWVKESKERGTRNRTSCNGTLNAMTLLHWVVFPTPPWCWHSTNHPCDWSLEHSFDCDFMKLHVAMVVSERVPVVVPFAGNACWPDILDCLYRQSRTFEYVYILCFSTYYCSIENETRK